MIWGVRSVFAGAQVRPAVRAGRRGSSQQAEILVRKANRVLTRWHRYLMDPWGLALVLGRWLLHPVMPGGSA